MSGVSGFVQKVCVFRRNCVPILFAIFSLPVFIGVAYFVLKAEQDAAESTLVRSTEIQNAGMARIIANSHQDSISFLLAFDIGDAPELLPIALERSGLEEQVRESLQGTNIANLKIYDVEGNTVFSLRPDEIGRNIADCGCFQAALGGKTVNELVLEETSHPHPEDGFSHASGSNDVLTTLLLIGDVAPDIVYGGVLEVQSDIAPLMAGIAETRQEIMAAVILPLAGLYIGMVAILAVVNMALRRREAEAVELASEVAQADAANRAKSEFLSLMSHELRTPLNAIIGFADLIGLTAKEDQGNRKHGGDHDDESPIHRYAQTIVDSGHHMLRQIISILDLTAIELGELELNVEPVQAADVVLAAADNVRDLFDRNLVTLVVHEVPELPPIPGDRDKLQQVFENLLGNAARYTPAGGQVDIGFGLESDGTVLIGIQDTGVGMTREEIDRARLPFQHEWNGYSRDSDGTGLGLTIADRIVTRLGGVLDLQSERGVGTTVVIRMPQFKEQDAAEAAAGAAASDTGEADAREIGLIGHAYAMRLPRSYDPDHADESWMSAREKAEERSMASVYAARVNAA